MQNHSAKPYSVAFFKNKIYKMPEAKKLNPAAIIALKEALAQIYWYKKDLRSFLINTLENSSILSNINYVESH